MFDRRASDLSASASRGDLNDDRTSFRREKERLIDEVSNKERQLRESNARFLKEKALLEQKCEFAQLEIKELHHKLKQNEEYSSMVMQFTDQKPSQQDQVMRGFQHGMEELEVNHKKQIKSKDIEIQRQKEQYEQVISQLNDRLKSNVDYQQENISRLQKHESASLTDKLTALTSIVKQLENRNTQLSSDILSGHQQLVSEHETRLEKAKRGFFNELQTLNDQHQHQIRVIKDTYDEQIGQMEELYQREKNTGSDTDLHGIELSLYEEVGMLKGERDMLLREVQATKKGFQDRTIQLEERVKQMEVILKQKQNDFTRLLKENESAYERQLQIIRTEKLQLLDQLEDQVEKTLKLELGREQSSFQITAFQQKIQEEREELERKRQISSTKNISSEQQNIVLRGEIGKLQKDNIELRVQLESLIAGSQEKDRLYSEEHSERAQKLIDVQRASEEKVKLLTKQFETKLKEQNEKAVLDRISTQKNNLKIHHNLKETEHTLFGQMQALERELADNKETMFEKTKTIGRNEETNRQLSNQQLVLQSQLKEANINFQEAADEQEKFRNLARHFQEKFQEAEAAFATQKLLNDQKIDFLETQKLRSKKDLADAQSKFQKIILKMQQVQSRDRSEQKEGTRSVADALERRSDAKLQSVVSDYESKLLLLEQQLRIAQSRALSSSSIDLSSSTTSEVSISLSATATLSPEVHGIIDRMRKRELSLLEEISSSKKSHDMRLSQVQQQHQQELFRLEEKLKAQIPSLKVVDKSQTQTLVNQFTSSPTPVGHQACNQSFTSASISLGSSTHQQVPDFLASSSQFQQQFGSQSAFTSLIQQPFDYNHAIQPNMIASPSSLPYHKDQLSSQLSAVQTINRNINDPLKFSYTIPQSNGEAANAEFGSTSLQSLSVSRTYDSNLSLTPAVQFNQASMKIVSLNVDDMVHEALGRFKQTVSRSAILPYQPLQGSS